MPGSVEPCQEASKEAENTTGEATMGWQYIGHGEWVQVDTTESSMTHGNQLQEEPGLVKAWMANNDADIKLHHQVLQGGYPNRWGARIPVQSTWNLELLAGLLTDYDDKEIVQWLKYGWPTRQLPTLPAPCRAHKNHKGATEHPQQMQKYISKAMQCGAVMGPYGKIPFSGNVGISPLSS